MRPKRAGSKQPNASVVEQGSTVSSEAFPVKLFWSKKYPPCVRGSNVWNGAIWSGSPGNSKSKLFISSLSSDEVMRTGNPLWKVTMPEVAQPFRILPAAPDFLGIGSSQK